MSITSDEIIGSIAIILTLIGLVGGVIRWVLNIYEQRLDDRYEAMEAIRNEASAHWERAFSTITDGIQEIMQHTSNEIQERRELRQYLDVNFVRQDTYLRDIELLKLQISALNQHGQKTSQ